MFAAAALVHQVNGSNTGNPFVRVRVEPAFRGLAQVAVTAACPQVTAPRGRDVWNTGVQALCLMVGFSATERY